MNPHGDYDKLRSDIESLQAQIHELADRVLSLEHQTPEARQAGYEADLAAADLAASGIDDRGDPIGTDRHGASCQCPWCYDEPEPEYDGYDPGPECDDQGGMSEYRSYAAIQDTWDER